MPNISIETSRYEIIPLFTTNRVIAFVVFVLLEKGKAIFPQATDFRLLPAINDRLITIVHDYANYVFLF